MPNLIARLLQRKEPCWVFRLVAGKPVTRCCMAPGACHACNCVWLYVAKVPCIISKDRSAMGGWKYIRRHTPRGNKMYVPRVNIHGSSNTTNIATTRTHFSSEPSHYRLALSAVEATLLPSSLDPKFVANCLLWSVY